MKIDALIKKARKGDKKAFLKLIELEKDKLYKTAYLYTKNKDDALDIVQDTICKALNNIHKLNEPQYFSTWLTKILINASYDFLRKKKKILIVDFEISDKVSDTTRSIEENIDLFEAIEKLNHRHQTIIILRYYQDKPIKEIAEMLEIPEGTVKSNLHRALQILKVNLKEDCVNG